MDAHADYVEVNELARRTGVSARYWKDRAKDGDVNGVRLGKRTMLTVESVNAFLRNNQLRRLEQPDHLKARSKRRLAA